MAGPYEGRFQADSTGVGVLGRIPLLSNEGSRIAGIWSSYIPSSWSGCSESNFPRHHQSLVGRQEEGSSSLRIPSPRHPHADLGSLSEAPAVPARIVREGSHSPSSHVLANKRCTPPAFVAIVLGPRRNEVRTQPVGPSGRPGPKRRVHHFQGSSFFDASLEAPAVPPFRQRFAVDSRFRTGFIDRNRSPGPTDCATY